MITIRDSLPNSTYDDCAVFPPVNHENLHIPSHNHTRDQQKQHHPPSDLVTRPILSSTSKQVFIGWLDFALDILRAKICCIYSWFCNIGETTGASKSKPWSFLPAAGTAVFVLWWWFCRRSRRESVEHLKLVIKHKDEVCCDVHFLFIDCLKGVCGNANNTRY